MEQDVLSNIYKSWMHAPHSDWQLSKNYCDYKKKRKSMIIGAQSKLDCYTITIGENHFS